MIRLALLGAGLRWRITLNGLRRRGTALFVLSIVAASLGALIGFTTLAGAATLDGDDRRALLLFGCSMVVLAWMFAPLLVGGADETVDPAPLALLPLEGRRLAAVLAGAAVTSPAVVAVAVALLGGVVAGWSGPLGSAVALLAMVALFVFGLGTARTLAALMGLANRSRRGRDLSVLVAALAGMTLWIASQSIGPVLEASSTRHGSAVLDVMAMLPPGWAARAVLHAHDGRPLAALGWVAPTLVLGVALVWCWARLTGRMVVGSARHQALPAAATARVWPSARDAATACLAKEWRYQWRSPTKRTQAIISLLMSIAFTVLQVIRLPDAGPKIVYLGMMSLLFASNNAFNVVGFDSPSLWLDVAAGGRLGRHQLRARLLVMGVPVTMSAAITIIAIAAIAGEWSEAALALAEVPGAVLCLLGVGAVISAAAPLPFTDGDNPFKRPAGASGCSYALAAFAAMLSLFVLLLPVLLPTIVFDGPWRVLLAVGGAVWGAAVWRVGLRRGERTLERHGPDVLAELSARAVV